jgi:hypothetical protein
MNNKFIDDIQEIILDVRRDLFQVEKFLMEESEVPGDEIYVEIEYSEYIAKQFKESDHLFWNNRNELGEKYNNLDYR